LGAFTLLAVPIYTQLEPHVGAHMRGAKVAA
jgi:hypothetical protein